MLFFIYFYLAASTHMAEKTLSSQSYVQIIPEYDSLKVKTVQENNNLFTFLQIFALEVLLFLYNTRHYFHTGWSVTAWNFYTNARILRSYYSMRCRYRYRRPRFQQLKGN